MSGEVPYFLDFFLDFPDDIDRGLFHVFSVSPLAWVFADWNETFLWSLVSKIYVNISFSFYVFANLY